jgi:hypothetical protein
MDSHSNDSENHHFSYFRRLLAILVAAAAVWSAATIQTVQAQQPSGQRPNVLVIWGDDVGLANVSAYSFGVMGIKTPNIDRIAREGLMFTDSTPSRVARRVVHLSLPASQVFAPE